MSIEHPHPIEPASGRLRIARSPLRGRGRASDSRQPTAHRIRARFWSAIIAILAIALSGLAVTPAYAAAGSDTLSAGERLNPEQRITSTNGAYSAVMQSDGNFVLYGPSGVRWASNTAGNPTPAFVIMQTDGNLVVYGNGAPKWWTRTSTPTGAARLVVQNDGNLVVYDGGVALWQSNTGGETPPAAPAPTPADTLAPGQRLNPDERITSANGSYFAKMQTDGNFAVYGPSGAIWSSGTNGNGSPAFVIMQTDGNLVVYGNGTPKWWSSSKTTTGAARLVMQNDGNLVVYDGSVALWSSKSSAPAPAPGGTPVVPVLADSSLIPCAAGTSDLGLQAGWLNGKQITIHLCAVNTLTSTGDESRTMAGANGKAIVNSRVSGAAVALVASAKSAGITLKASSSYRTNAHQTALYNTYLAGGPLAAKPGYSNHQMGLAIDFGENKIDGAPGCGTYAGTPPAAWTWLTKNAGRFGFKQLKKEHWHWDASGSSELCS